MPALSPEQIHERLAAKFSAAVGPLTPANRDPFCTFAAESVLDICRHLRTDEDLAFDFLQDLTATDHPKTGQIAVVYSFYSYKHRHQFRAKVELPRRQPEVTTVEGVWKAANFLEREVYDLFGVIFLGHTDLRRIMLPDDWVGHPLRKDYVEHGGYQGISNIRDNPLDQYLVMDRARRAEQAAKNPPPAPVAAPKPAAPSAAAAPATAATNVAPTRVEAHTGVTDPETEPKKKDA